MNLQATVSNYNLAWWLAAAVADDMPAADRTATYLELGGGQHWECITRMLAAAVRLKVDLSDVLLSELGHLLDAYVGHAGEPAARAHLAHLRRRAREQQHATFETRLRLLQNTTRRPSRP
jgi:hypothetical protein